MLAPREEPTAGRQDPQDRCQEGPRPGRSGNVHQNGVFDRNRVIPAISALDFHSSPVGVTFGPSLNYLLSGNTLPQACLNKPKYYKQHTNKVDLETAVGKTRSRGRERVSVPREGLREPCARPREVGLLSSHARRGLAWGPTALPWGFAHHSAARRRQQPPPSESNSGHLCTARFPNLLWGMVMRLRRKQTNKMFLRPNTCGKRRLNKDQEAASEKAPWRMCGRAPGRTILQAQSCCGRRLARNRG